LGSISEGLIFIITNQQAILLAPRLFVISPGIISIEMNKYNTGHMFKHTKLKLSVLRAFVHKLTFSSYIERYY